MRKTVFLLFPSRNEKQGTLKTIIAGHFCFKENRSPLQKSPSPTSVLYPLCREYFNLLLATKLFVYLKKSCVKNEMSRHFKPQEIIFHSINEYQIKAYSV